MDGLVKESTLLNCDQTIARIIFFFSSLPHHFYPKCHFILTHVSSSDEGKGATKKYSQALRINLTPLTLSFTTLFQLSSICFPLSLHSFSLYFNHFYFFLLPSSSNSLEVLSLMTTKFKFYPGQTSNVS